MNCTVVIIGAGHAGLAMSRRLTERSIDHVVLERGEVANSWRHERWDSLSLLTPNWQTALPGLAYNGDDPDGYGSADDLADFISRYASVISAPVISDVTVIGLTSNGEGYEVRTNEGPWRCRAVVIATGGCNLASIPPVAKQIPPAIALETPMTYRRPDDLAPGPVLVVGASASGVQLAQEIHRSGRPVTLSVGEHVRLPRLYRGRDIFWWMSAAGVLDERYDEVDDLVRARNLPSPQLIGASDRRSVDLNSLAAQGIRIVGRLAQVDDGIALFSGSLSNLCALADLKMNRLLDYLDDWAATCRVDGECGPPERFEPTRGTRAATLTLDLPGSGIATVLFATGYRPDYSWLGLDILDRRGRLQHDGGIVREAPGVYTVGGSVLRRRRSSYIGGAGTDSADIAAHLHHQLDTHTTASAVVPA